VVDNEEFVDYMAIKAIKSYKKLIRLTILKLSEAYILPNCCSRLLRNYFVNIFYCYSSLGHGSVVFLALVSTGLALPIYGTSSLRLTKKIRRTPDRV